MCDFRSQSQVHLRQQGVKHTGTILNQVKLPVNHGNPG